MVNDKQVHYGGMGNYRMHNMGKIMGCIPERQKIHGSSGFGCVGGGGIVFRSYLYPVCATCFGVCKITRRSGHHHNAVPSLATGRQPACLKQGAPSGTL